METRIWALASTRGGEAPATNLWAIQVLIAEARAGTDETLATTVTTAVGVEAANPLEGFRPTTKTLILTGQVQECTFALLPTASPEANEISPKEPRFGRLRGRSASPASDEDGDGRFGFAENATHAGRTRYRSRSRSHNNRRRREPSADRWTHDRANYDRAGGSSGGGRWQKDAFFVDTSPMGNHHRSNAIDVKRGSGNSLLSRMTKDGQPVVPQQKRSLADRITRDSDDDPEELFGRLKNDDRDPRVTDFSEPARPRRGLADRISRDTDMSIRGQGRTRSQEGINIRGSAERSGSGINIRGVASGA